MRPMACLGASKDALRLFPRFLTIAACGLGVGMLLTRPGHCSGCMSSISEMIYDYNQFRDQTISLAVRLGSAGTKAECCSLSRQIESYADLQLQVSRRISFCQGDDETMREFRSRIYPERKRRMGLMAKKCCVPFAKFQPFVP